MVADNGYDERFAKVLKDSGISVSDMASRLDVSYQAIKKIVEGKSKMMNADNNARAAAILGVDPDWLATGNGSLERGHRAYSAGALRVAAIYDQVSPKDRRHIDAVADAAASPDDPPEVATHSGDRLLPEPTPVQARRS